jgi:hypothetical protein
MVSDPVTRTTLRLDLVRPPAPGWAAEQAYADANSTRRKGFT